MNFELAYDLSGVQYPIMQEFDIAGNTAIKMGEAVKLVADFVVSIGETTQTAAYLGVAAESHDGVTAGRQSGGKIRVWCSPTAVFRCKPNAITTATGGDATKWTDSALGAVATDTYKGGQLKAKTAAALTNYQNRTYRVTGFTTTTGDFAATLTGGVSVGDTAIILPPVGSTAFKFNANNATNLNLKASGGSSIQIVRVDEVNEHVYWKFAKHQLTAANA